MIPLMTPWSAKKQVSIAIDSLAAAAYHIRKARSPTNTVSHYQSIERSNGHNHTVVATAVINMPRARPLVPQ